MDAAHGFSLSLLPPSRGWIPSLATALLAVQCLFCPPAYAFSSAPTVDLYACESPLVFQDCTTSARGWLMCKTVNHGDKLVYPDQDWAIRAWSYDAQGARLQAETGHYADSQLIPGGHTYLNIDIGPAAKVFLCAADSQGPEVEKADFLFRVSHRIDWVSVALLVPLLVGGLIGLYLTLYGMVTGYFPDFKKKKALRNFLRILRRRSISRGMADDWIVRSESPVQFWVVVMAGLWTSLPLIWFAGPWFIDEAFGWALW